jgi:hypothetical protein
MTRWLSSASESTCVSRAVVSSALASWASKAEALSVCAGESGQGRVEPATFRFSGAYATSRHVAGCGLMGDLAAETMAGCRLMWPDVCRRWLPVWLPNLVSAANVRPHEYAAGPRRHPEPTPRVAGQARVPAIPAVLRPGRRVRMERTTNAWGDSTYRRSCLAHGPVPSPEVPTAVLRLVRRTSAPSRAYISGLSRSWVVRFSTRALPDPRTRASASRISCCERSLSPCLHRRRSGSVRSMSPGICHRWLPTWLPSISLALLTFERIERWIDCARAQIPANTHPRVPTAASSVGLIASSLDSRSSSGYVATVLSSGPRVLT